jgi:hypothetical protein
VCSGHFCSPFRFYNMPYGGNASPACRPVWLRRLPTAWGYLEGLSWGV